MRTVGDTPVTHDKTSHWLCEMNVCDDDCISWDECAGRSLSTEDGAENSAELAYAEEAAKMINSGDVVWVGALTSGAPQVVDAVTDRYEELENVRLVGDFSLTEYKCFKSSKYKGHVSYVLRRHKPSYSHSLHRKG